MLYFAYGSNLNAAAVADWSRYVGIKPPVLREPTAAVLENYRLGFPVYSDYWGGGVADVSADPGKTVMGALWDVSEADLDKLERKSVDGLAEGTGSRRIEVDVRPFLNGPARRAVVFTSTTKQGLDVPPTETYLQTVVAGAYDVGLSMMWISYLKSFATQPAQVPGRHRA